MPVGASGTLLGATCWPGRESAIPLPIAAAVEIRSMVWLRAGVYSHCGANT
jgi:hypothetical protein